MSFALVLLGMNKPLLAKSKKSAPANPKAVLVTAKGKITIELFPDKAPIAVENFIRLSKKRFYDGLIFHRYVKDFVIQTGSPDASPEGGPGYTIRDEHNNGLSHLKGAVAMAHLAAPNSAGSQFFICLQAHPELDGKYTVFGRVVEGMEALMQLRAGDKIKRLRIRR